MKIKHILILLNVLTGLSFGWCQTPEKILENYELVWQDEFDGRELDMTKWSYRAAGSKRGNALVRKENCYLDQKGHLIIEASKQDTNYYVGQIATHQTQLWRYGYFECRAKLNNQLGPSTAFWLQSPKYGSHIGEVDKAGAEIDIMEYKRKDGTNNIYHTVHWDGYREHHQQKGKRKKVKGVEEGFHTFGLKWTEKKYVFYVDGKRSWCTRKALSKVMQYIILSVELVDWGGEHRNSTYPDRAVYDYVRVYQEKEK
ncbi:MAG: glycoside hydrolase family 16 protein [Crocinitomicaceae bacterium]